MAKVTVSDTLGAAATGAGLGLGASSAAAGLVALAPTTAVSSTVFAGVTFTSGGVPLVSGAVLALASNPVGWAIGAGLGFAALWALTRTAED